VLTKINQVKTFAIFLEYVKVGLKSCIKCSK